MKHKPLITIILLSMFLITQFIGLYVVHSYSPIERINPETNLSENINPLPYGMQPPSDAENAPGFISLIISFVFAIALILILIRFKWKIVIRIWFFIVITLAIALTLNSLLKFSVADSAIISFFIALPFAVLKIFRPTTIIHNFTELLIYPGISAVFVPILNVWTAIALLIVISIYDMWAVWRSGLMQKMAKFQMEEVKIFGGFLIPRISKKVREQIKKLRKTDPEKLKKKKFKISLAILGGGDVVFPIIVAGVFLRAFGLIPALCVTVGALAGLTGLLIFSSKKKFYPAMPFISAGIFLGMIVARIFFI